MFTCWSKSYVQRVKMMSKQSAKDVKLNVWISNVKRKKKKKMMADRSGNVHSIPLGTAKGSRIKIIKPTTSICFRAWRCIHVSPFVSLLLKHKAVTGLQNCTISFLYGFFRPGIELARLSDLVLLPFCNNNSFHFNPAGYAAAAG